MWNKDQFKIMELIVLILSYLFTVVFLLVFCVVGTDPESKRLLQHIFEDYEDEETGAMASCEKELGLHNLDSFIDNQLTKAESKTETKQPDTEEMAGRLGPENVVFDIHGNSGTLVIEADRLGVASHSNFSTIRANTCVFRGKWVYELMLGSKGVMQVGWATMQCRFSTEEGVGDTTDSYAYDGNRLRKWNVSTSKYGQAWLTGDVISCAIDCGNSTITFCRNGQCMGEAFNNVRFGPGIAYFPAVSLSLGENLRANFGATPLRYPLEGYNPLQDPPTLDLVKAQQIFTYLEKLLPVMVEEDRAQNELQLCSTHDLPLPITTPVTMTSEYRSRKATLLLIASHLFDKMAPFLRNSCIVEACLFRFLLKFCDSRSPLGDQPYVHKMLDLLWALMQEHELKPCLEHLVVTLLSSYRFSPVKPDFSYQHMYLTVTLAVLQHDVTRKYLLKHILFDKVKFAIFMHIKPPDDAGLAQLIPTVWWGFAKKKKKNGDESEDEENEDSEELEDEDEESRLAYLSSCNELRERIKALEEIQVEILKVLLNNRDHQQGASSRFIFLHKFREFLKENSSVTIRGHTVNQCPLPVSLCFFHRLIQAVRYYWDEFAQEYLHEATKSSEAYVPCRRFYDDSINYFDTQRLGGLLSHLKKHFREDLNQALGVTSRQPSVQSNSNAEQDDYEELLDKLFRTVSYKVSMSDEAESGQQMVSAGSLVEILDGIVLLYNLAAHKQLGKMCSLRDNLNEYVAALEDTRKKIATCPSELDDVQQELKRAETVFIEKTSEQVRHMAWVIAVIYAKEKQEDVFWLLQVVLRTMEHASLEDRLFSFVPDFYVEVIINSYNALRSYFHPTMPYQVLTDFQKVLMKFATFLSRHFADSRIVNSDIRDSIVQALACFVCYPKSLKALEQIPKESQMEMVQALLAPYENRSWAQTNWILVRLWKGCGFAFRYKHLPHVLPVKTLQQEIGSASLQKPCPSKVYQEHIRRYLSSSPEVATKLIDSLLNQLNWAFSEFVGMLQELQQIAQRPMPSYVDSRQLKICATCFDISVGLLRVLEMIAALVPQYLVDWTQPSAELLLCRLFQLLTQVLNRVTSRSNMFDTVVSVSMPGLETVDHFPILTAVAGILITLVVKASGKRKDCATAALLAEPGFQLSTLEFLLGRQCSENVAGIHPEKKIFSLKNSPEYGMQLHGGHSYCQTLHAEIAGEMFCDLFVSAGRGRAGYWKNYTGILKGYQAFKERGTNTEVDEEEAKMVDTLITHLRVQQSRCKGQTPDIEEDMLCNICYARPKSAVFRPCGHQSCRACISHHLMNKKECFFCKTQIDDVDDLEIPFASSSCSTSS